MLQGRIDEATRHHLSGWAFDPQAPGPVTLSITIDGNLAARVLAGNLRNDLMAACIGDGCHGFSIPLIALAPQSHTVQVCNECTGEDVPGSPLFLPPAGKHDAPATPLQGRIDQASHDLVRGWVRDADTPESPVSLLVSVDGVLAARILANGHRPDLEEAGLGVGRHAFLAHLPGLSPLRRHLLRVQREGNGLDIPGSPAILAPTESLNQVSRDSLAALLAQPAGSTDLDERIQFLVGQTERLLQLRTERHARRAEREQLRQLRRRWRPRPDPQAPTPGVAISPLRPGIDAQGPPALVRRALVIDDATPVLDRDAGSHAIVSHMRSLQRLGHAVAFMPSDTQGGPGAAALEAFGIQACHAPWYASVEELLRREAGGVDLVYLHRVSNARYLPLIRHHLPRARLVFAVADLHYLRLARQAEVEQEPDLLNHSRRVRATEIAAARMADVVVTHSTSEAALLRPELPANRVHVVPWSVQVRPTAVPHADRHGLAFVGGYRHAPNVDAAHRLVEVIMPLVWALDPTVECRLVGSDMPDTLRALAGDRVVIDGHVPDLAAIFDRVRLTVAPLSFGAGVKGKVLDSMAAGIPCACTPVAAEGIALPDLLAGLVASDVHALAAIIHRLHADPGHNQACSQAGLDYATTVLSEDALDVLMRRVAALPA